MGTVGEVETVIVCSECFETLPKKAWQQVPPTCLNCGHVIVDVSLDPRQNVGGRAMGVLQ